MKTVLQRLVRYTGLSCALAGLCTLPAQAVITLSLTPSTQAPIPVGGTASVILTVNNIDPQYGLGAWLVWFSYDDAVISISSDYDSLDLPSHNAPGGVQFLNSFGSSEQFSLAGSGLVSADETSLVGGLMTAGPFQLAKFTFTGVSTGISSLVFEWAQLSQADGKTLLGEYDPLNSIMDFTPVGAEIEVYAPTNGVPDTPVTLPLIAVMGLLLAFRRHGRRAA